MAVIAFEDFTRSLSDLGTAPREDPEMQQRIQALVTEITKIGAITRESLAVFVTEHPDAVPLLATCAGLGQEQLINQLKLRLGTSGWVTLARERPDQLVNVLDEGFGLVDQVRRQIERDWSLADVLLERHLWSRKRAASAVGQGRNVEDEVEQVVRRLNLPYRMRVQFTGRGGASAPCDLAIPDGGGEAQIVVGMKGFNSTGSKLSDAVREIEQMATVRRPSQFVYAFIDGIGWLNRQADLKRIYEFWANDMIDGLYSLTHLSRFEQDLEQAARQKGLLT